MYLPIVGFGIGVVLFSFANPLRSRWFFRVSPKHVGVCGYTRSVRAWFRIALGGPSFVNKKNLQSINRSIVGCVKGVHHHNGCMVIGARVFGALSAKAYQRQKCKAQGFYKSALISQAC